MPRTGFTIVKHKLIELLNDYPEFRHPPIPDNAKMKIIPETPNHIDCWKEECIFLWWEFVKK